jgi:ABC-type multidrug transport system ATPase subunit
MDEAALCDRIALIQDGKILDINKPEQIVAKHKHVIYDVKASNPHQLILLLKAYPSAHSVYPFGEFIHYTDQSPEFKKEDLRGYLDENGLEEIVIQVTPATIEDAFMELAN